MTKIFLRIYFSFFVCFFTAIIGFKSVKGEGSFRRLAMFIDNSGQEYPDSGSESKTMTERFSITLHQKMCPIIVSQSIFINFLVRRYDRKLRGNTIKTAKFKPDQWSIYRVNKTSFFVLLPKIKEKKGEWIDYDENEVINLGKEKFQFSVFKKEGWEVFDVSACIVDHTLGRRAPENIKKLFSFVQKDMVKRNLHPSIVEDLNRIFVFDEDLKKKSATKKAILRQSLFEIQELLEKIEKKEKTSTSYKDKKSMQEMNFLHAFAKPWNVYIAGHGSRDSTITGLSVTYYPQFLKCLNKLNIWLVRLTTCSAGGDNRKYMLLDEGKPFDLRYLLIINSIHDAVTALGPALSLNSKVFNIDESHDTEQFFQLIEQVCCDDKNTQLQERTDLLKSILPVLSLSPRWLTGNSMFINSIPQVLIPKTEKFNSFPFNGDIFMFGKVAIQSSLPEGLHIKDKKVILLSEEIITGKVIISYAKLEQPRSSQDGLHQIFPCLPDFSLKKQDYCNLINPIIISTAYSGSIHLINSIEVSESGFLAFIRDSFFHLLKRESKKTFYIKSVYANNDVDEIVKNQLRIEKKKNKMSHRRLKHESGKKTIFSDVFVHTWHDYGSSKNNIIFAFRFNNSCWKLNFNNSIDTRPKNKNENWNFEKTSWHFTSFTRKKMTSEEVIKNYIQNKVPEMKNKLELFKEELEKNEYQTPLAHIFGGKKVI